MSSPAARATAQARLALLSQQSPPIRSGQRFLSARRTIRHARRNGTSCSISWNNASGGNWSAAPNWTDSLNAHRIPTSSDDVCITLAGTYTVTEDVGTPPLNSITLGGSTGSQALVVAGT
ncbi:MAG TPA: hypothetical protein VG815_19555, partial [Chloroflexota bacterium]|nr:hypothetical protein [Chloroflexota bacterium]